MPTVMLRFDVDCLDGEDVNNILDALWAGKTTQKHVLAYIKDVIFDYVCPDCEERR